MARPLGNESGAVLTLELQQRFTLGHFRVSVSNDPSLSGTLSQVSPRLPLFVNLGGEAEMRDGIIWEASVPFEGVGYGYIGGRALKSSAGAPPLSSCISGIEAFRVQLPNGKYAVSLIFCGRWPDDVKSRSFSVSIEGRKPQTISNIPAVARGAQSVAFFNVQAEVSDGVLDVNFEEGMGETVLNGITINQAR